MKQTFLLLALVLAVAAGAQKTVHDANAAVRSVKGFHALEISDGIDLYLSQGNEEAVAVSASATEYRDKIKAEVVNGVLKIYYDEERSWRSGWTNRKMKAYVTVKSIDRLSAGGGSDILFESDLNVPALVLHISGGSDFKGKLNTRRLELTASGGSDAYLSGEADEVSIAAAGGSDVHGFELITNHCRVQSSGGSDVKITANKSIDAQASGGSDVLYKGSPSVTSSKSGGGSVKKVG